VDAAGPDLAPGAPIRRVRSGLTVERAFPCVRPRVLRGGRQGEGRRVVPLAEVEQPWTAKEVHGERIVLVPSVRLARYPG